ncbi:hypothetical protein GCM10025868_07500 [Angustibacter aerolatus]|uniref:Uncharacterized protein n=1 Tax=Angustibacter aerolatus TaxID=1162965 RepID=A0ABQ6JBF0_9ACTN|nr:hypothetical protein GCM10025868_07500 [Angustibacter aerolatus]
MRRTCCTCRDARRNRHLAMTTPIPTRSGGSKSDVGRTAAGLDLLFAVRTTRFTRSAQQAPRSA